MRFRSELGDPKTYPALVALQEAECSFLDCVRRCVSQRIKCDRDYSASLAAVVQHARRYDSGPLNAYDPLIRDSITASNTYKAWNGVIQHTESIIKKIQSNADRMCALTLDRIVRLYSDKMASLEWYKQEINTQQSIYTKSFDAIMLGDLEYHKLITKISNEKMKISDMEARADSAQGKSVQKRRDSEMKLNRLRKTLHLLHNDQVNRSYEFNSFQGQQMNEIYPHLLDYQQNTQENFAQQIKDILSDYTELTDFSSPAFRTLNEEMQNMVSNLQPDTEYNHFISSHKSKVEPRPEYTLDNTTVKSYDSTLDNKKLIVDSLTIDMLNQRLNDVKNRIAQIDQRKSSKINELKQLNIIHSKYKEKPDTKIQAFQESRKIECIQYELETIRCSQDRFNNEKENYEHSLSTLDGNTPSVPFQVYEETSVQRMKHAVTGKAHSISGIMKSRLSRHNPFRRESLNSPPVPKRDFMSQNSYSSVKKNRESTLAVPQSPSATSTADIPTTTLPREDTSCLVVETSNGKESSPSKCSDSTTSDADYVVGEDIDAIIPPTNSPEEKSILKPPIMKPRSNSNRLVNKPTPSSPSSPAVQESAPPLSNSLSPATQTAPSTMHLELEEEGWFHGVMPREDVQRLLKKDGDFLVRQSKDKKTGQMQYVLSAYCKGHKHFIIQGSKQEWRLEGQVFPTVQQLVEFQLDSGEAVTKKTNCVIKVPICREGWELDNGDLDIGLKIGNGNFGEVFKGIYKPTGMEVAIKTCQEKLTDELKRLFLQEARILRRYNHPNIVQFIGIAAQRQPVMIVMEYVQGGSLQLYLKKKGKDLDKHKLTSMCVDASSGMVYLEANGCIHRDLAARNCLVTSELVVKISDFGMSRDQELYQVSHGMKQIPIKWTAPEALNYGTYTSSSDVWSFAVLMWEIFSCGITPYPGLTNKVATEKIDQGYRMPIPEGTPENCYNVMLDCWNYSAEMRPNFKDVHNRLSGIASALD